MSVDEYSGFILKKGSHRAECSVCLQKKRSHEDQECQRCASNNKLIEGNKEIQELEDSIEKTTDTIDEIEQEQKKLEERKQILIKKLESDKISLEIQKLNIKINLVSDTVSDNVRVFAGTYEDEPVNLETHCTIVRVSNSPEDVYFGHVTLIITYSNNELGEYKWHYGVKTINDFPDMRLNHEFWQPIKNPEKYLETNKISFFGDFKGIPKDKTLSDMMITHFNDCIDFFYQKEKWPPNQVWSKESMVDSQNAIEYLKQLDIRVQDFERLHTLQSDIDEIKKQKIFESRETKRNARLEDNKKKEEKDEEEKNRRMEDVIKRKESMTAEASGKKKKSKSKKIAPQETHQETPAEDPAETPVEDSVQTSRKKKKSKSKKIDPVETPQETPAEDPAETPAETPVEDSVETSRKKKKSKSKKIDPVETPQETPAEDPAEDHAETPPEDPAKKKSSNKKRKQIARVAKSIENDEFNSVLLENLAHDWNDFFDSEPIKLEKEKEKLMEMEPAFSQEGVKSILRKINQYQDHIDMIISEVEKCHNKILEDDKLLTDKKKQTLERLIKMKDETEINKIEYTLFKNYCKSIRSNILQLKELYDFSESESIKTLNLVQKFSTKLVELMNDYKPFLDLIQFHITDILDYQETKTDSDNQLEISEILEFLNDIKSYMEKNKNLTILNETFLKNELLYLQLDVNTSYIPKEEKLKDASKLTASNLRRELIINYKNVMKGHNTLANEIVRIKKVFSIDSEYLKYLYRTFLTCINQSENKILQYTLQEKEYILELYKDDTKFGSENEKIIIQNLCIVDPKKFQTEALALSYVLDYKNRTGKKRISTKDLLKDLEYYK